MDITPLTRDEQDELDTHARSFPRAMLSRVWLELKAIREDQNSPAHSSAWKDGVIEGLQAALRPFAKLHVEHSNPATKVYERPTPSGVFAITNADIDRAHQVLDDVGV